MAVKAVPSVLQHLWVWLSASAKAAIRKGILMTDGNQEPHAVIWNALASRAGRLMRRPRPVIEWGPGASAFFENGSLKPQFLEHL
jgi:hypothetical protein